MTAYTSRTPHGLLQTVLRAKGPIGSLGGAWMSDPAEDELCASFGLQDWQLYFLARHGVLGAVDADVVSAAAYVFPPDYLRREWDAALRKLTPEAAVDSYLTLCHEWGRRELAGFADAVRLTELAERIIEAVEVAGLPLFAGWRAVSVPLGQPERCTHAMQLLREHRGSCHGVAMVALGLQPLTAVLANQGGEANARDYGWEPPFPEVTDTDRALREQVELLTDDLVAPPYAVLTTAEQQEFVALLDAAFSHAFGE
jgi:hypothetical protein